LLCLWVIAVVVGFLLGESWPVDLFIPLCALLAVVGMACTGWLWLRKERRSLRIFAVIAGVLLLALACGWVHGRQVISDPRGLLGQHVSAIAQVLEVRPGQRYTWALLQLREVTTDRGVYRCQFAASVKIYQAKVQPVTGQTVELTGVLSSHGRTRAGGVEETFEFVGHVRPRPTAMDRIREVRDGWLHQLRGMIRLQPDECALLGSLLFGDDSLLSKETKQAFLAAGLLHVLAASGSNLLLIEGFITLLTRPLWRVLRVPFPVRVAFQLAVIWCYAALCEFQISMVRAALMSSYRWMGMAAGRKAGPNGSLLWTAALLTTADPQSMLSLSAVLSFLATAAVQQAVQKQLQRSGPRSSGPWWKMYLMEIAAYVRSTLVTTVQVELWLFPVLAVSFRQFTPYAVLSNLLTEPILMALLPLALLTLCTAWLCTAVGWLLQPLVLVTDCLGVCVHAGLQAFLGVVEQVSALPLAVLDTSSGPLWYVAYGAALVGYYWKPISRLRSRYQWNYARWRHPH
jgi:ComEC/Rec2-related protein